MRPHSPFVRPALALLALGAMLSCTPAPEVQAQSSPAARAPAATPAGPAQAPPKPGPVEELYKQRQYEAALRKADELRGAKQVTPANEYWAARALRVLKRYDEAAARFRELSKDFPGTDQAASADVDAWVSMLGKMPDGHHDAAARKMASEAGDALLGVAKKYAESKPGAQARALYIAGNAFRMAHADDQAAGAYGECRTLTSAHATGYPDKCTLGLGSIKARNWQESEALALYRECALQDRSESTARRCSKSLARTELVGFPAPDFQTETWLNGPPQSLAQLRGKVVMIFFFATWCPHCKETLPTLPRFLDQYGDQPFQLLAMTNNVRNQTTESTALFIQDPQWKISYPVGIDANGATTRAMEASGIPQVILIDKKGVVRWSDHPAYLKDEMVATLLAEPGGA